MSSSPVALALDQLGRANHLRLLATKIEFARRAANGSSRIAAGRLAMNGRHHDRRRATYSSTSSRPANSSSPSMSSCCTSAKCGASSSPPALPAERQVRRPAPHQLAQLEQVEARVGRGDEAAAGPQHARDLRERAIEIRHVVEHPRRDDAVELAVARTAAAARRRRRASTPRSSASSTIRGERSTATTSAAVSRAIHSASSPQPQPTSSTRLGRTSATASTSRTRASSPVATPV